MHWVLCMSKEWKVKIIDALKNAFISKKAYQRSQNNAKPHTLHEMML